MGGGDLLRQRQRRLLREPGDEGGDPDRPDPSAPPGVLAERAEDVAQRAGVEPDLLVRLAQRGLQQRLVAGLVPPARQAHVARPGVVLVQRALQQEHPPAVQADEHRGRAAGALDGRLRALQEPRAQGLDVGERARHVRSIAAYAFGRDHRRRRAPARRAGPRRPDPQGQRSALHPPPGRGGRRRGRQRRDRRARRRCLAARRRRGHRAHARRPAPRRRRPRDRARPGGHRARQGAELGGAQARARSGAWPTPTPTSRCSRAATPWPTRGRSSATPATARTSGPASTGRARSSSGGTCPSPGWCASGCPVTRWRAELTRAVDDVCLIALRPAGEADLDAVLELVEHLFAPPVRAARVLRSRGGPGARPLVARRGSAAAAGRRRRGPPGGLRRGGGGHRVDPLREARLGRGPGDLPRDAGGSATARRCSRPPAPGRASAAAASSCSPPACSAPARTRSTSARAAPSAPARTAGRSTDW